MTQKKPLPLHTQIFIGLFVGLIAGLAVNFFAPQSEAVKWIASNVAYPIGQIFFAADFYGDYPTDFFSDCIGCFGFGRCRAHWAYWAENLALYRCHYRAWRRDGRIFGQSFQAGRGNFRRESAGIDVDLARQSKCGHHFDQRTANEIRCSNASRFHSAQSVC